MVDDPELSLPFKLVYNKMLAEMEHSVAIAVKTTLYTDHL